MNASRRRLPFLDLKRPGAWKRGQGLVEFALTIPILLLLLWGIMESGRYLFNYISVVSASREADRYAVAIDNSTGLPQYGNCAQIRAAAKRVGFFAWFNDSNIRIYYDNGPGQTPTEYCWNASTSSPKATDSISLGNGQRIKVQVSAPYRPLVPLVNFPSYTITFSSIRTLIVNAPVAPVFQ